MDPKTYAPQILLSYCQCGINQTQMKQQLNALNWAGAGLTPPSGTLLQDVVSHLNNRGWSITDALNQMGIK